MTPTPTEWTVLYDASNRWMLAQRVSYMFAPAAILFVVAAVFLKPAKQTDRVKARQGFLLTFFIGVVFAVAGLWIAGREISLGDAVTHDRYTAIVGHVTSLIPAVGRHSPDRLVVRTTSGAYVHYRYVNSVLTPGFTAGLAVGRPMRVGACVSIADVGGTIARLAIADQCDASSLP